VISASDYRLCAGREVDPGRQSGHRRHLLLSAEFGWHGSRSQRDWLQAQDDRRRHGRAASYLHKDELGPLLNGFVNFDYWMPIEKMKFAGVSEFLTKYQGRAQQEGVDALGYHIAPCGYAQLQVLLQQAVAATNSLDDDTYAKPRLRPWSGM
jgi:hypothetical protein